MTLPTEPIGSIPAPPQLLKAIAVCGDHADPRHESLYKKAIQDTQLAAEKLGR